MGVKITELNSIGVSLANSTLVPVVNMGGPPVTENITMGNIANFVLLGTAANAVLAGTVVTAAQPNITSVGTLTSLTVSGNIVISGGGNLNLTGNINASQGVFTGGLSGVLGVSSASQPNITALGTLTGLSVSGVSTFSSPVTISGATTVADRKSVV